MLLKEVTNGHRLSPFFSLLDESASGLLPPLDIYENNEHYELRLDVPGVAKEDLKVDFEQDTLTIRGERKNATENLTRSERWAGSFERTLSLPEGVDSARIKASVQDGVLAIVVPKGERAKPRQITIQ
jgi:HSP20 family protein